MTAKQKPTKSTKPSFYQNECNRRKKLMGFVALWNANQGGKEFEMMLWQCFQCKSIAVTFADEK